MKEIKNPITAEVTVSYDYNLSRIYFEDSIKTSPLGNNVYQYIDYGNIELIDCLSSLISIDKSNSKKDLLDYLGWDKEDGIEYTKEELRDEILDQTNFNDIDDLEGELSITKKYLTIITRGYSQGDYAKVIIPTKLLRDCWGSTKEVKNEDLVTKEYIDNLFWDAPISGMIEIFCENGQDYEFELYEIDDIPEYLNYPQDIDYINEKIVDFVGKKFKNVPAKENIIKAIKTALPSEIYVPRY